MQAAGEDAAKKLLSAAHNLGYVIGDITPEATFPWSQAAGYASLQNRHYCVNFWTLEGLLESRWSPVAVVKFWRRESWT